MDFQELLFVYNFISETWSHGSITGNTQYRDHCFQMSTLGDSQEFTMDQNFLL